MISLPAAELELATMPIEDPALVADPNPELDRARAHHPAQRLRHPRLAADVTWRRFPRVWGIASLPIRFTPAPTQQPARTTVGA